MKQTFGTTEKQKSAEKDYAKMLKTTDNGLSSALNGINDIYQYHPTAIIDNALVGDGTKIWQWTHICDGASIGKYCTIGQNVYIGPKVRIGNNCKIQNNVFIPEGVKIESDVFIGPSVTFTNVKNPRAVISRKDDFKSTVVGLGASIGAGSTVLCDVVIGQYTMIGAGSVVTKNISDFEVAFGNPAVVVGTIGMDGGNIRYFEI